MTPRMFSLPVSTMTSLSIPGAFLREAAHRTPGTSATGGNEVSGIPASPEYRSPLPVGCSKLPVTGALPKVVITKVPILLLTTILAILPAGCGSSSQEPVSDEPSFARVIVTKLQLSTDGGKVDSITVRTDEGENFSVTLGGNIDPAAWSPRHLEGHIQLGEAIGATIGIKYIQTTNGEVAIELTE